MAVLFQRGSIDPATDFEDDQRILDDFFRNNEHKYYKYVEYPGVDHALISEEVEEIIAHFKKWL